MKQFWFFFLFFCLSLSLFAQQSNIEENTVEMKDISNPEFNWPQFDNENAECKFRKESLVLECKKNKSFACTTTELDFDIKNVNCVIGFLLEPEDLDDKHLFGIVFDYKNHNNFQTLCFGKKSFQLVSYEGSERAVVQEGLYKLDDDDKLLITLKKRGKRLDFYIGNQHLPLFSLRNSNIQHSAIGFYVENKTKVKINGIGYRIIMEREHEE